MSDTLVHAELLAACSALGYSDGVKYHREADCLETTKDLVRYLRRDDDTHEVRLGLGDTRVLRTDLLPLVRDYSDDKEQFDVTIRLLVNLTNPVLLLFREELPEEKVTRQMYLRLITQQQNYKEAFVEEKVWGVLVGRLGELLQLDWEHRQEEDRLLVERILILIRNVLAVPASPEDEKRTDDDASVHDQVLWALHLAGLEDLLLYVASSHAEQDLCMHVLEIISLMLREQDPAQLAGAGLHRSEQEKEKDEKELMAVRQREAIQRQQQRSKQYSARHSRFGGTYYVQNMKSISDRDLISHQPLTDITAINFDRLKKPKKHPKHRVPMRDSTITRRSTLAIRLFLQEFCVEFLNGAYNSIMYIVKDNLRQARAQEHDESYYLWAIRFFMEFNQHHQFKIELVSETLSVETFHYIQTQLETYYEHMAVDKKKIPLWSRRMHKAVRAYQELLFTLAAMDKCQVEGVRESSKVLKSKVFYVVEYREMVLVLLQNYDPLKMPLTYLKDVVETAHIFLKLLEGFCSKNNHIVVQQKAKKKSKKKTKTVGGQTEELTEDKLQDMWDDMAGELSAVVQGEAGDLPATIPFDALSEEPEEEQKEAAMRKINLLLRKRELLEAVSLLRSARDVWPEGDVFGAANMDYSDEFLALREIFMANLNPPSQTQNSYVEEEEDEDEEEEQAMQFSEQEFSFQSFVRRFANSKVMEGYCRLLQDYRTNSAHTNHCILKLFHRIAWDCKLSAIFFQASLFNTFQKALDDTRSAPSDSVLEIGRFAKYILRQFFKVAETNPKVFMEILFWKTNQEALEIECGYEAPASKKKTKNVWLEEEEDELRRLYEEMSAVPEEERGEQDVVDLVMKNLINQTRARRVVIKKLKELGLINNLKELKRKPVNCRAPRQWTEEEEAELRMLFEENRDAMDIVGRIMDNMALRRPKHRVVEKILELGLVTDKKELRKKRPKKVSAVVNTKSMGERFLEANQGDDDVDTSDSDSERSEADVESDREEGDSGGPSQRQRANPTIKKSAESAVYTPPVVTPALISEAMTEVLGAGMSEAVEWLAGVIKDVADDREEDGDFEPVPVLAIAQACIDAMDDPKFHKLLRLVGLQPPQTHQEMFWRIPSYLSVPALRKRASYLTQGLNGDPVLPEKQDEPLEPIIDSQETETVTEKPKKRAKKTKPDPKVPKKNSKAPGNLLGDGDSDDDMPLLPSSSSQKRSLTDDDDDGSVGKQKKQSKRRKRQLVMDDDSDDESQTQPRERQNAAHHLDTELNGLDKQETQSKKKKRRLVVEDDSGDEQTHAVESQNLILHLDTEQTERLTEEIPSAKAETQRGRKVLDSDSENDDVPLVAGRHRTRTVIESDDE